MDFKAAMTEWVNLKAQLAAARKDLGVLNTREKQLKRWHRQWKINLINEANPEWRDLAVGLGLPPLASRGRPDGP